MGALTGIRVCDLTWAIASPFATMILALMGAEVIKVENPQRPDSIRLMGTAMMGVRDTHPDANLLYNQANLNKLSISLDLKHPEGHEIVLKLAKLSDVFSENYSSGAIDRLGLGYPVIKAIKPDIIMISSCAAGRKGPQIPGTAGVFGAMAGLSFLTGYPGLGPSEVGTQNDFRSATVTLYAIMAALYHRQQTGQGQYIDFSCLESQACFVGDSLLGYAMNGHVAEKTGNHDDVMVPHSCYRAAGPDDWITIAVATETEWGALCEAMEQPELASVPRFSSPQQRRQYEEQLDGIIAAWAAQHTTGDMTRLLQARGIAAFASMSAEALLNDPHLNERGCFVEVEHPRIGVQKVYAAPFHLSRTPALVTRPSATLAQDNEYVFGELLGMSKSQIADLTDRGVIFDKWGAEV